MRRILKFELKLHGEQVIEIEGIGTILHVNVQNGKPFVWIDVNEYLFKKEEKRIRIFHTGEEIPNELLHKTKYIGTFFLDDGCYVGHVYQIIG